VDLYAGCIKQVLTAEEEGGWMLNFVILETEWA
jgi:hypothetical protein